MSIEEKLFNAISTSSRSKVPIKAVFKVIWFFETLKAKTVYLAFSNECFLILSDSLDEVPFWSPVYYMDIEHIIVSTGNSAQIMFQMKNVEKSYPAPTIPIYAYDSTALLERISVFWRTCYMSRTATYEICPILKRNFLHPHLASFIPPPSNTDNSLESKEGKVVTFRGYKLLIPNELVEDKYTNDCYRRKIITEKSKQYSYTITNDLFFEVSEHISNNILSKGYLADNLKYLCEKYELHLMDVHEGSGEYTVHLSSEFKKTIDNDLSEWEGWETCMVGKSTACSVIALRRKYIPPLMNSYQYIIIFSLAKFTVFKLAKLGANAPHEPEMREDEQKKRIFDLFLEIRPQIIELVKITRQVADSVVPVETFSSYFERIIDLRKNSLFLQFDEIAHLEEIKREKYETPRKYIEEEVDMGKIYTVSVINLLARELTKLLRSRDKETLIQVSGPMKAKNTLTSKIELYNKQTIIVPTDILKSMVKRLNNLISTICQSKRMTCESPEAIADLLESSGFWSSTTVHREDYLYWREKVANYLAAKLNLVSSEEYTGIPLLCDITNTYLESTRRVIGESILHYLFHLREKDDIFMQKISVGENFKQFVTNFSNYEYNDKVMCYLLQTGLAANICNRVNHSIYPNLIYKLLTTTDNFEIIRSAFIHLNSEPFDRLLLLCTDSRVSIEQDYVGLLEPTAKLLYSTNEELVIHATNFTLKLIRLRISNDTDIWKFPFHSIVIRNLYRTGSSRVARVTLELLGCLISLKSMPLILSDPELKFFESTEKLCLDIKLRPEKYTGEDLYRLLIMTYAMGTQGAAKEQSLIQFMYRYSLFFAGYKKPYYGPFIQLASQLFSRNLKRRMEAKKQENLELALWKKIWENFVTVAVVDDEN